MGKHKDKCDKCGELTTWTHFKRFVDKTCDKCNLKIAKKDSKESL